MGLFTKFLKLFTTNMETDGDDFFDFERDINEPFRKIDSAIEDLQGKSDFIPFCFNSGLVNENGEPALLELSTVIEPVPAENEDEEPEQIEHKIITLKAPAVYTDGNGKTTTITEDLTLDVTDLEPGEYSLRVAENNGIIEFSTVNADVYKQKIPPENPKDGDLWQNLSVAPNIVYKYKTSTQEWLPNCNEVEAGKYTKPEITEHPDLSGGGGV